jgi:hypothetical protein
MDSFQEWESTFQKILSTKEIGLIVSQMVMANKHT